MVAVVSANGLGLFNSSLSQLGSLFGGQAGIGQSRESQMVNIANGNLLLQDLDESLEVRGFDASFLRTYNSRGLLSGSGQDGFVTGYERSVTLNGTINTAGSTVTLATGDGQNVVFAYSGTANRYVAAAGSGANDTLTWNATSKQWTFVEGSTQRQEVYADPAGSVQQGRLVAIKDGRSQAEFDIIYDNYNRVSQVLSVDGTAAADAMVFGYNGTTTQLLSVTTVAGGVTQSRVEYGYDSFGRLSYAQTDLTPKISSDNTWSTTAGANDGHLYRTTYAYTSPNDGSDLRIAKVTTSDGVSVAYTYESDLAGGYRVKTVAQGSGASKQTVTFTYHPDTGDAAGYTDVTDGDGRTWSYYYDGNGQLTQVQEPAVDGLRTVTTYTYDTASGNVQQIKTVRGAATLAETDCKYDANGNLLWKWQLVDGTGAFAAVHYTYNAANQVLTEVRYAALDPDGPGSTAPASGGALTTTFVYDTQNRLRFTVDGAGEVTERTYATSGNGVGQLASERQYLGATYAVANGVTEAALMAWATTAQQASSTLSAYAYDAKGRLQQQIDYDAVDTVATDAAYGQGVLDAATAITRFTYNAQGQLLQRIVVHGSASDRAATVAGTLVPVSGMASDDGSEVTDYTYDGLGRVLGVIQHDLQYGIANDTKAISTIYAYTDSADQIQVTLDSGLVRTELRNAAGQLVSVSEAGMVDVGGQEQTVTRTTAYFYDAAGLLRATRDALGGVSYLFYDDAGRISAQVDATGAVTHLDYDELDHLTTSTRSATRVDTSGWLASGAVTVDTLVFKASQPVLDVGQAWVKIDAANDRASTNTYDDLGRLTRQTDAAGLVTSYAYDGLSHLLSVTVAMPGDATVIPRVTSYYYDKADRQVGVVDPAGYLTESMYDAAGRLTQTIRYATLARVGTTLATQRPVAKANDVITRYFYDGRDQLVGQLAYAGGTATVATGYLTTYSYDEQLHQTSSQGYSLLLAGLTGTETLASLQATATAAVTAGTATVRNSQNVYNGLGQLINQTNFEGTFTTYVYDEAGRLVRTNAAQGTSDVRTTFDRYDVFGELIGQISGQQAAQANADAVLAGKQVNDATLSDAQLDTVYGNYGTTYSYDADGRVTQGADALGNKSWFFYDADGRQTYTVHGIASANGTLNALGEVTQMVYNAFGQAIDAIRYTDRIALPRNNGGDPTWANVQAKLPTVVGASDTQRQMSYDQRGLLVKMIDGEQAVSKYSYTAFGQLYQQQTAAETIQYAYDARGEQTSRTEALGTTIERTVSQTYDAFGRVVTSTDALGTVTSYTYDRLGRQLSQTATIEGRVEGASATYDAYGRTLTQTDALGNTTHYAYDDASGSMILTTAEGVVVTTVHNAFGQTVQVTTAAGVTHYTYDHNGALLQTTDANGKISKDSYDVLGRVIEGTDATGRRVDYSYDAAGRVLTRTVDPGDGHLNLTTIYAYDGEGRQVRMTDATGRVTTTSYDRESRVLSTTVDPNGLNLTTSYSWDAAGNELTVTQGDGTTVASQVKYGYDALGRRTSQIVDPGTGHLNLTTSYAYDSNDNLVRRIDANGNTTRFYYDHANRLIYTLDPLGAPTKNWYDADGRLVATRSLGLYYDTTALTDTTSIATLDQQWTWNTSTPYQGEYRFYDRDGRLGFTLDTQGHLQEYTYDASGRLVQTRGYAASAWSAVTGLSLFSGATLASQLQVAALRNDALDHQNYRILDADGRVRYTVDALGDVTELRYDAAGRVVEQLGYATPLTAAELASAKTGTLSAQALADLTSQEASAHSTYQVYDGAGRMSLRIDALGDVSAVGYDAAGRVIASRSYATAINLTTALKNKLIAGTALITDVPAVADDSRDLQSYLVYDSAGRLQYSVDGLGDVTEMRYDTTGQVVQQLAYVTPLITVDLNAIKSGAPLAGLAGRLATQEASAHSVYQVYDAAGRVRFTVTRSLVNGAVVGTVTENRYDAAGELTAQIRYRTTVAFDPTQTLASFHTLVANGTSANDRTTYYVYDAAGRQRFTVSDLGDIDGSSTDSYTVSEQRYDGLGRVVTVRNYGTTVKLPDTAESTVAAAVVGITDTRQVTYTYNAAGQLISTTDKLNQTESYGYDAFGNRTSLTNKLNNTWTYVYDAAGRQTEIHTPPVSVAYTNTLGYGSYVTRSIITQVGYDALGNVLSRTEDYGQADARTTNYAYDAAGHQVHTIFPDPGMLASDGTVILSGTRPDVVVTYDALGRAVMQKDVLGHYSYKVYDAQGRLAYDIDAAGYATGYSYDALGEQVGLTRYAGAISSSVFAAHQPISLAQMATALTPTQWDRTLTTAFDAAGNKTSVVQSAVTYFKADGTMGTGSPTTLFQVNAYGEVVEASVQLNDTTWANTHHYYDNLGRKSMDVDALGYVTAWTYTAQGDVASQTEYARALSAGVLSGLSAVNPPNPPAAGNDTLGYDRTTAYGYDTIGRKVTATVVGMNYESSTGIAHVRDIVTRLGYDAVDEVTSTTVDGTLTATTFYDALGHVSGVEQAQRAVLASNYNSQLTGSTTADLNTGALYVQASPYTSFSYDAFGNRVQVYQYANGWVAGQNAPVSSANDRNTTTRYDFQGRAVAERDARNNTKFFYYDAAGNVLTVGHSVVQSDGSVLWETNTQTYDALNQQLSQVSARNGVADGIEQVHYNAFGEVIAKGDVLDTPSTPATLEAVYAYDNAGRMTYTNAQGGVPQWFWYNLAGYQVVSQRKVTTAVASATSTTNVAYNTWQTTDALGRVIAMATPGMTGFNTAYQTLDRWGNVIQVTDANGNVTQYQYNALNQKTQETQARVAVVDADGTSTPNQLPQVNWYYDDQGLLVGARDANGHVTQYQYDAANEQVAMIDPFARKTYQAYDAFGDQVLNEDQLGYITWQNFDALGEVTAHGDYTQVKSTDTTRASTALQTYTLDQNGNRIAVADAINGTYDDNTYNRYDSRGLLTRSRTAGQVMLYAYDHNGNKILEEDGDTTHIGTQTWSYDYFGRVTAHKDLGDQTYGYTYDATSGELVWESIRLKDATTDSLDRSTTYYASGQVKTTAETQIGSAVKSLTTTYTYDFDGNRISEDTNTQDGQGAVVHVTTTTDYDSHNRIQKVAQVDAAASNAPILTVTYSYDAAGNRRHVHATSGYVSGSAGDQNAWYTYDAENRVVIANGTMNVNNQIAVNGDTPNGYVQLYDDAGHMAGQRVWGKDGINGGTGLVLNNVDLDARGEVVTIYASQLASDTAVPLVNSRQTFDADGRLLTTCTYFPPGTPVLSRYDADSRRQITVNPSGMLKSAQVYTYDNNGRVLTQQQRDRAPDWWWDGAMDIGGRQSTDLNVLTNITTVDYTGNGVDLGYDTAGRLLGYKYVSDTSTQTYRYTYQRANSWLENTISGTSTDGNDKPTASTMTYDMAGRQIAIKEHTNTTATGIDDRLRYFAYDAAGEILRRMDGTASGTGGTGGTGGNGPPPPPGGGNQVPAGTVGGSKTHTMSGTAAPQDTHHQIYVNGQLIGSTDEAGAVDVESNQTGFSSSSTGSNTVVVQDGETLQDIAQRIYGNANLWYVLAAANGLDGSTAPVAGSILKAPQVTTNSNDATTFKPYNPADITGPTAPSLPHITPPPKADHGCGTLGMIIMIVVAVVATICTAGAALTALTPVLGSFGAGIAAGAIGGAVGSLAGEAVGSVLGVAHFSWSGVAAGAITGAITGGLGAGVGSVSDLLKAGNIVGAAGEAIADVGANYVGQKLVGEHVAFSWKSIAASAVGTLVGAAVANNLPSLGIPSTAFNKGFASGLTGGLATAVTRQALGIKGADHYGAELVDAFGNALGSAFGAQLQSHFAEPQFSFAPPKSELQKWVDSLTSGLWAGGGGGAGEATDAGSGGPWGDYSGSPEHKYPSYFRFIDQPAGSSVGGPQTTGSGATDLTLPAFADDPVNHVWDQMHVLAQWNGFASQAIGYEQATGNPFITDRASVDAAMAGMQVALKSGEASNWQQFDSVKVEEATGLFNAMLAANGWTWAPSPQLQLSAPPDTHPVATGQVADASAQQDAVVSFAQQPASGNSADSFDWSGQSPLGLSFAEGGFGLYRPNSLKFGTPSALQALLENSPGNRLLDFDGRARYNKVAAKNAVTILERIGNGEITPYQGARDSVVTRDQLTLLIRKTSTSPETLRKIEIERPEKASARLREILADPVLIDAKLAQLYQEKAQKLETQGRTYTPDDIYREIAASGGTPNKGYNAKAFDGLKMPLGLDAGSIRTTGRALGVIGMVYGAVSDGRNLYNQYEISQQTGNYGNTYQEGSRIAGGWTGAIIGGELGAQSGAILGGLIGSFIPIVGTGIGAAVGGFVGGLFGGYVGYMRGGEVGTELYQGGSGG